MYLGEDKGPSSMLQKDGFHIADDLKTCEKIPDPPYTVKNNVQPPLLGLKK